MIRFPRTQPGAVRGRGDLQAAALYEADITILLQKHRSATGPLLEAVRPHVGSGQFTELGGVVGEIEARIARMARASGH